MSPVARSSTTAPPMAPSSNGYGNGNGNGFAAPANGVGAGAGAAGRKAPYAHIDDLTSVAVDLDPHTPLRKVLEVGDAHMRQATTFNDFKRPDLALQEYIKAFTIAVDKVPKHKDYPSLKNDRGDLSRLYNALKTKITTNGEAFDKIKETIKEDNRKSGVQSRKAAALNASETVLLNLPSVPSTLPSYHKSNGSVGGRGSVFNTASKENASETPRSSTEVARRSRPAVQPKPQALHGNAITPGMKPTPQDLASRFAKLRDPHDSASLSKPVGPREMPTANRPQPTVNSSVPNMPKMPDAIYSPARGTVTSELADLPSSTPRGMFSRTNSIVSTSGTSARNSIESAVRPPVAEQYVTAHTFSNGPPQPLQSPRMPIPQGDTITPDRLNEYMQKGAGAVRLLLIDVRSREEFDEGHIMAQSTICVDPSVLARGDVSAADIEASMGIAPDEEMQAFEHRGQYDLVVFYDQDTLTMPQQPSRDAQDMALYTLYQALVHYNYDGELRNAPKLLTGGVESWVDLFGQRSLKESQTSAAIRDGHTRSSRVEGLTRSRFGPRRRRNQTKTLQPEEIQRFEQVLKEDEAAVKSPIEFVRSTEDFLRRFPSASEIQESMISMESHRAPSHNQGPNDFFETDLPPTPPTRPAPSVPRTSYSGLSSRESSSDMVYAKSAVAGSAPAGSTPSGLINGGNKCYANSLIQALLASPGFAADLTSSDWPTNWLPDGQATATKDQPQLMSRILGNLLQWLSKRQLKALQPSTLLKYSNSIHTPIIDGGVKSAFGDHQQHDPAEYFEFILDQLQNETNRKRAVPRSDYSRPRIFLKDDPRLPRMTLLDFTLAAWAVYCTDHESVVEEHWAYTVTNHLRCTVCRQRGDTNESVEISTSLFADAQLGYKNLYEFLDQEYGENSYLDNVCTVCKQNMRKKSTRRLGRMPPLLRVQPSRYSYTDYGTGTKLISDFEFPLDNLDLTKYTVNHMAHEIPVPPSYWRGKYVYDLYAVISHSGASKNSGHYVAYVRDGPGTKWWQCNDSVVTPLDAADGTMAKQWFKCANRFTPCLLFYKRKDMEWKYPPRA